MKILALDSSGLVASVAVVENDTLLAEYTVNYKKTHSQTLLPMLDEISNMTELDLSTIDAIAVAGGSIPYAAYWQKSLMKTVASLFLISTMMWKKCLPQNAR